MAINPEFSVDEGASWSHDLSRCITNDSLDNPLSVTMRPTQDSLSEAFGRQNVFYNFTVSSSSDDTLTNETFKKVSWTIPDTDFIKEFTGTWLV